MSETMPPPSGSGYFVAISTCERKRVKSTHEHASVFAVSIGSSGHQRAVCSSLDVLWVHVWPCTSALSDVSNRARVSVRGRTHQHSADMKRRGRSLCSTARMLAHVDCCAQALLTCRTPCNCLQKAHTSLSANETHHHLLHDVLVDVRVERLPRPPSHGRCEP